MSTALRSRADTFCPGVSTAPSTLLSVLIAWYSREKPGAPFPDKENDRQHCE